MRYAAYATLITYALWVFYLAIMNLAHVKRDGARFRLCSNSSANEKHTPMIDKTELIKWNKKAKLA